jgi:KUP system potassium uptake protein
VSDPLLTTPDFLRDAAPESGFAESASAHRPKDRMVALTLGALGIVFGDIGTSPLYALRESVRAASRGVSMEFAVMGALSLIFWSLIIVVTLKYVVLIMRADNEGEGGVLALASLAHRSGKLSRRMKRVIGLAAILGLALFYGDGMLTPAISVLSAVEGLGAESHAFATLIIPLTVAILIGLFIMQSRGTAMIGRLFGPIMVVWFATISVIGLAAIVQNPGVLWAINPWHGLALFLREPWTAFVALGAVVLAVTGCEALYADMGHFGKAPIRNAWVYLVLPALVLDYFGQGATLMRDPHALEYIFFASAPHWAHYPLVALATMATVIASQAVISGVYSITRQAVQLGQLPRMEIRHTSAVDYGQIYVPRMNTFLAIGVVLIVLIFRSSAALATAYGIAVTGVMVISTFLVSIVAARQWGWGKRTAILVFGPLALIDLAFLSANSLKIVQGGWLPIAIAAAVFLSARGDVVPGALLHNLKHNKVLHERVILAHVEIDNTPVVPREKRIEVKKLGKGFFNVTVHHGFFETPDVPKALSEARPFGLVLDVETTTFFIGHETLVPGDNPVLGRWRTALYTWLASGALSPARFYHLPPNRVVELGTQVTI